jgi:DNA-binding NarL/FixJ family response regulator
MKKRQRPATIRVMVVDDHASVRQALRYLIDSHPDLRVVAEAESGLSALRLFPRATPDIVLMDGSMPDMNGIETTRRIKQIQPKAKIIGLSVYAEPAYLKEMIAAGASGYVLKAGAAEGVITAIRLVNNGGTYLDPGVPRRVAAAVVHQSSTTGKLTKPELAVAKLLAKGKTSREIADSLGIKEQTVEKRRAAAMKKLDVRSRVELIRLAADRNWLDD